MGLSRTLGEEHSKREAARLPNGRGVTLLALESSPTLHYRKEWAIPTPKE